ncbi:MAG: hypothetical protein JKX79_06655 [Labilibaculum sp.]|nr:hypothetical protein [Labilibaculum sp.]
MIKINLGKEWHYYAFQFKYPEKLMSNNFLLKLSQEYYYLITRVRMTYTNLI